MRAKVASANQPESTGASARAVSSRTAAYTSAANVVVLAGTVGPDPAWTRGIPRSLLPLPQATILEALLHRLCEAFPDGTCTVCANSNSALFARYVRRNASLASRVDFYEDHVPRGTAGCIKGSQNHDRSNTVFVTSGAVWLEDDPRRILHQHLQSGNDLTVFCVRRSGHGAVNRNGSLEPIGVYCCQPIVLEEIPERGYRDLKEQIIPRLQGSGFQVGAIVLSEGNRKILDWRSYLFAVERAIANRLLPESEFAELAPGVWCGRDVKIAPSARVVGPVFLGHWCRVDQETLLLGPVLLGEGSHVGRGSTLMRVIGSQPTCYPPGTFLSDQLVLLQSPTVSIEDNLALCPSEEESDSPSHAASEVLPGRDASVNEAIPARLTQLSVGTLVLLAFFVWAFWFSFVDLWQTWSNNEDYSAGQIVPLAAVFMAIARRHHLRGIKLTFGLPGAGVFALGLASNLLGNYYLYSSLENIGLVLCANGLAMSLLGWQVYKRLWHSFVILFLMVPLPGRVHDALMLPLQDLSTRLSVFLLEIVGVTVERYGNVLQVRGREIAVAEACSGLRMVLAFVIVTCVFAFFIRKSRWQKTAVVASSVPIGVVCNILRIVAVVLLFVGGYESVVDGAAHEVIGLLMMPVAVCFILLELWVLSKLVLPSESNGDARLVSRGSRAEVSSGAAM